MAKPNRVTDVTVRDIRFPTTLEGDGSDALNIPDYSSTYVTVHTDTAMKGHGITFTCGRGNEIVCLAVQAYKKLVIGQQLSDIYNDFAGFWEKLANEPQLRWLGPEKGATHLALAAVINALWDLWARMEGKPLWKLIVDMTPEKILSTINFRHITDCITKEEALAILKEGQEGKDKREAELDANGYPSYTTSAGWMGYSDEKISRLAQEALDQGFTRFKVKVGSNFEDDMRRVKLLREKIGPEKMLATDANQRWDVNEAIEWMKPMAKYNITWIEEPTSPDDVLGHKAISEALAPYGIGVATGEACQNKVVFKQFLQSGALQYAQIDSCRMAGPNEILAVYLMAKKLGIPVCPHAGGVGLCELVNHLQMIDYCIISKTMENRVIEYVDHLHEHFENPVIMRQSNYLLPKAPGYSTKMKEASLADWEYPNGNSWQKLFAEGKFQRE